MNIIRKVTVNFFFSTGRFFTTNNSEQCSVKQQRPHHLIKNTLTQHKCRTIHKEYIRTSSEKEHSCLSNFVLNQADLCATFFLESCTLSRNTQCHTLYVHIVYADIFENKNSPIGRYHTRLKPGFGKKIGCPSCLHVYRLMTKKSVIILNMVSKDTQKPSS